MNRVEGRSYNDSVDQWCLGILCYEFVVGRPPFEAADSENTYDKIRRIDIDYPNYLSIGAKDLICSVSVSFLFIYHSNHLIDDVSFQLLQKSDAARVSLIGVMKHPWIKKYTS